MSDDFSALLKLHVNKQTLARKRKAVTGVRCNKNCTNPLFCPNSHGDNLEHCLCDAWWCPKSHPNRRSLLEYQRNINHNEKYDDPHKTPPEGYVCKRCKSTEHYINNCPQNVCTYCQDIGHIATNCPHNLNRWRSEQSGGWSGDRNVKAKRG